MNKETVEKMVSSARDEAGKMFQGAKEIVTEENVQKAKDFAKGLGTQEGREKAAESARQAAKTSKTWCLNFWKDVRANFKPDANLSGVAAWKSRCLNLWACGVNGKIAYALVAVALGWGTMTVFSGGNCPVKELVGYKLGDVYDGPLTSQLCMAAERMEGWWNVEKKVDLRDFKNVAINVTPKTHRIAGIQAMTSDPIRDTERLGTELSLLEKLFKDKYGAEFSQLSQESFIWIADKHKCVVKIFYMNWANLGWVVCIQLYQPDLVDESEQEAAELAKEKLEKEAAKSSSGI